MKKTLLAAVVLASFGMTSTAMAEPATSTFQWSGTVPVVDTTEGFEIVRVGDVDFSSGTVIFAIDSAGVVTLDSSNDIGFNVIESATGATPGKQASYTMTLESLKLGNNDAPGLKIVADNVDLVRDLASASVTKPTKLKVAESVAGNALDVTPGSLAVVQAIVKIAPAVM